MARRELRALLEDALGQIDDLLSKTRAGSLEALIGSRDLQAIFERRFEVLGEVMRPLARSDPEAFARIGGARLAIDLRNFISHGYDGVDHRILWATAVGELPTMRLDVLRELAAA